MAAGALLLGAVALVLAVRQPFGPTALILLLLGALLVGTAAFVTTLAVGFFGLGYYLSPGALTIRWAGRAESVSLNEIEGIYAGQRVGGLRRVRGVNWPGYHIGLVRSRSLGNLRVYCTDRQVDALAVVVTPTRTLVLTPADPPEFRRELVRRIEAVEESAPSEAAAQSVDSTDWPHPIIVSLIAVAVAFLLLAWFAIAAGYQALPEAVPLADVLAWRPAASSARSAVHNLPLLGAALLALNLGLALALRRRESATTVLLCGSASLVETVVLLSTLRLLP